MPRALLSVSDKTGIVELGRGLAARGFELVSTGGTARALTGAGLPVTNVSEVTGVPEMMDGPARSLLPKIHAGFPPGALSPEHLPRMALPGFKSTAAAGGNLHRS